MKYGETMQILLVYFKSSSLSQNVSRSYCIFFLSRLVIFECFPVTLKLIKLVSKDQLQKSFLYEKLSLRKQLEFFLLLKLKSIKKLN